MLLKHEAIEVLEALELQLLQQWDEDILAIFEWLHIRYKKIRMRGLVNLHSF